MKIQIGSLHLMEVDDGIGGRTTIPKLLCQKYYRPSNSLLIILFWDILISILNLQQQELQFDLLFESIEVLLRFINVTN